LDTARFNTTNDAFKLISDAQAYGARVALFGRKINLSEDPLTFIEMLRHIVEEAVKAYHGALGKLGIRPFRDLAEDMKLTGRMMRYR
jgi:CMP-N-acetylneuraminic acid synthetase